MSHTPGETPRVLPAAVTIAMCRASGSAIAEYAGIPTAFCVTAVLDVADIPDHGIQLAEHQLETPYLKNYDENAEGPARWARRYDTSQWTLLFARIGGICVGAAAVANGSPDLDSAGGRNDLAVLWDLRVLPAARRQGVGAALFHAAEMWARERRCRELKIETQNINVAACTLYARNGCVLRAAHRGVYAGYPDEIQLLWYKTLAGPRLEPDLGEHRGRR